MEGKVKFFNTMKGFGFIIADDGKEYFVHYSGLAEGVNIKENDIVVFDVEEGDRGLKAVNVALKGDAPAQAEAPQESNEAPADEPADEQADVPEEDSEKNKTDF